MSSSRQPEHESGNPSLDKTESPRAAGNTAGLVRHMGSCALECPLAVRSDLMAQRLKTLARLYLKRDPQGSQVAIDAAQDWLKLGDTVSELRQGYSCPDDNGQRPSIVEIHMDDSFTVTEIPSCPLAPQALAMAERITTLTPQGTYPPSADELAKRFDW